MFQNILVVSKFCRTAEFKYLAVIETHFSWLHQRVQKLEITEFAENVAISED